MSIIRFCVARDKPRTEPYLITLHISLEYTWISSCKALDEMPTLSLQITTLLCSNRQGG